MGLQTTVIINNDALDVIAADPDFSAQLVAACKALRPNMGPIRVRTWAPDMPGTTGAVVVCQSHTDTVATIHIGSNSGRLQGTMSEDTYVRKYRPLPMPRSLLMTVLHNPGEQE